MHRHCIIVSVQPVAAHLTHLASMSQLELGRAHVKLKYTFWRHVWWARCKTVGFEERASRTAQVTSSMSMCVNICICGGLCNAQGSTRLGLKVSIEGFGMQMHADGYGLLSLGCHVVNQASDITRMCQQPQRSSSGCKLSHRYKRLLSLMGYFKQALQGLSDTKAATIANCQLECMVRSWGLQHSQMSTVARADSHRRWDDKSYTHYNQCHKPQHM
jgi:hypothetical protein